jgi:hypothetical protein
MSGTHIAPATYHMILWLSMLHEWLIVEPWSKWFFRQSHAF